MFRTRCALQKAVTCTTAFTTQLFCHLRCRAMLPGLHPSRVLLSAAFTNRDDFSFTNHHNQVPEAAHRANEEASTEANFSAAPRHESVFAHPSADTVDSLFGVPRLAQRTKTTTIAEGDASEHEDDAENGAAASTSDQKDTSDQRDDDSTAPFVSHGEEEILADRDLSAEESESSHKASRGPASKTEKGFAGSHEAARGVSQDAHTPVNLHGAAYASDMAATLRAVAHARNFISPFWSSMGAFEQVGASLIVPKDKGVQLPISNSQTVVLYNLEQTSLVDTLRAATMREVRNFLNQHRLKGRQVPSRESKPLNISGGAFGRDRAMLLATSATFSAWQSECPYWLTSEEVVMIGAKVRPAEEDNYIALPDNRRSYRTSPPGEEHHHADHDTVSTQRMYNLNQLEDDDGRFSLAMPVLSRLPACYSIRGTRYSPNTSWLMLEYCVRFCLPITTDTIVMLTAERVHAYGGQVLPTKRFLSTALAAVNKPSEYGKWRSAAARASLTEWITKKAVTDAVHGVVPPPFTVVVNNEVLTLYNAVQTDISDVLHERASRERENRFFSRLSLSNT